MDTYAFLKHVLPTSGNKIIALPRVRTSPEGETYNSWNFSLFESVGQMADAAQQFSEAGETVYFAVNGFGGWYEVGEGGKTKRKLRTQENVVACRSIYDDFDVGPQDHKYDTREEALAGVIALAQALRLSPTITSSGGGYHCYFSFDQDITPAQWMAVAKMKRDITAHLRLHCDPAVDIDSARVLRPVGTMNHKYTPAQPVVLVRAGKSYSYETVVERLETYIRENHVAPAPATRASRAATNPFAAAVVEYPPSSAVRIASHCNAVGHLSETRGAAAPEPVWRAMLGLMKYTVEGEALAHEWSQGDPRYDPDETQAKLYNWTSGPALCGSFMELGRCEGCAHAGKIRSPIQLGYTEEAPSMAEAPETREPVKQEVLIAGQLIPHWPDGYRWDGRAVSVRRLDEDGVVSWKPFLRTLVYPVRRIRVEDGSWELKVRALEKNGDWREFQIPTCELAAPDLLAKTVAKYEVFIMENKGSKAELAMYLSQMTENLQQQRIGEITVERLGWTDDFSGFVLGPLKLDGKEERKVLCGKRIPEDFQVDFGLKGTLEGWVDGIDRLLNRPGAELAQFALCHALGAPIVKLMGSNSWHGLPFVMIGESGQGKSTLSYLACSAFGAPSIFEKNAQQTTLNAALARVAASNNLPFIFDELTGYDYEELKLLGYGICNGRRKERLKPDGTFATTGEEWFTNTIVSSNTSVYEKLAASQTQYTAEAVALRFFEVKVPDRYVSTLWRDVREAEVSAFLAGQYGHAGRAYIHFLVNNNVWVRDQLHRARAKYNPNSAEETKERFYRDAVVTALVAGKIAQKIGLIHFDLKAMVNWATEQIISIRDNRHATAIDPGDMLARFIATWTDRIITTKRVGDGRAGDRAIEMSASIIRGAPIGRVATEDKKVFLSCRSLADWCKEVDYPVSAIKSEMSRTGLLIFQASGRPSRVMRLGTGTTVASSPCACYELNYNMLYGNGVSVHGVPNEEEYVHEEAV